MEDTAAFTMSAPPNQQRRRRRPLAGTSSIVTTAVVAYGGYRAATISGIERLRMKMTMGR
jgi:hypothetical protein